MVEPLGGAEGLLDAVSFMKATESMGIESQMPDDFDFQTARAATLKPEASIPIYTNGDKCAMVIFLGGGVGVGIN